MASTSSHSFYMSNYERMTGNCTRLIAAQIVSSISPPINSSSYILDNACGTGIVSEQIKLLHPDAKIIATDISPAMLAEIQKKIETEGWNNMQTDTLDIRALSSFSDNTFTHVITNLGFPMPGAGDSGLAAVKEIFRVLKPGGVAVMSTWADRVWPAAFLNAARAVRPNEEPKNGAALESKLMRGSWLLEQLEEAGFGNNVEVRPFMTYTSAKSLDELVANMLLAKQMYFTGYSNEELEQAKPLLREGLQNLRTFEEFEGGVRIGMKSWIGVGWKRGDEAEVPL